MLLVVIMVIDFFGSGWFLVLLILVYNIGDVFGRGSLVMYYVYFLYWVWFFILVRFLVIVGICLSVLFYIMSDRFVWMVMFVVIFGFLIGYLIIFFIFYVFFEVFGRVKEIVGYLSMLSMIFGMVGGSVVSYCIKVFLDLIG